MTTPPPSANTLDLRPLMFETFVCTLAVMSFVALVGPLARKLGLAPWQAGAAVTVGGIAWMLAARPWGIASDRMATADTARRAGRLRPLLRLALPVHRARPALTLPTLLAFAGIVPARPRRRFLRRGAGLHGGTGGRSRRGATTRRGAGRTRRGQRDRHGDRAGAGRTAGDSRAGPAVAGHRRAAPGRPAGALALAAARGASPAEPRRRPGDRRPPPAAAAGGGLRGDVQRHRGADHRGFLRPRPAAPGFRRRRAGGRHRPDRRGHRADPGPAPGAPPGLATAATDPGRRAGRRHRLRRRVLRRLAAAALASLLHRRGGHGLGIPGSLGAPTPMPCAPRNRVPPPAPWWPYMASA
ncbi:MFS transporter [Pseudomonas aeruginosa]|nr:MFS transporter [Pseudomonas aeruginosa]